MLGERAFVARLTLLENARASAIAAEWIIRFIRGAGEPAAAPGAIKPTDE